VTARRWLVVLALAAWALVVAVWAFQSWSDTHALNAPPDAKVQQVTYGCGPPWGKASVRGSEATPYPVVGRPCGHREERRRLAAVEIGVAVMAIAVVVGWRRTPQSATAP
jgi:hypothetical protein